MQKSKKGKKYSQAGRVHDVIRLIEARHGVTIEELVDETGVHRRTIHRDLIAIQEAGYPLVSEWQDGSRVYRFLTGFKDVPPINFSLAELLTLSLLRTQTDFLKGTPFHHDMESIARKVNSVLPARYAAHMERITHVTLPLLQGGRDYSKVAEQLRSLREALLYQYRVTISYRTGGKGTSSLYEVEPYTLIFYKGGLYLLGHALNRGAFRTFAVERIQEVTVGRERFEIPPDYRPAEQLQNAFGIVGESAMEISVRFSPEVAHMIRERIWHPTQSIATEPDGSIRLAFTAGGKMEIISWILSYGHHAEVLSPEGLREEVKRQVAEMATKYASGSEPCKSALFAD